jgi:hypothetical protein
MNKYKRNLIKQVQNKYLNYNNKNYTKIFNYL